MNWSSMKTTAAIAAFSIVVSSTAAFADKGCKNIQSRCAIEIGGRCDPVTGRWEYGQRYKAGGNTLAFDDCIRRSISEKSNELTLKSLGARPPTKVASILSAATARDCRGLGGWGRFDCVAHNHPHKYMACGKLATARGHSNRAPGRASFILTCMIRARPVAVSERHS